MILEKQLFQAADKMRGAMDAGEYKHVALGLLFLRYVSAAYELKRAELSTDEHADPEDPGRVPGGERLLGAGTRAVGTARGLVEVAGDRRRDR